MQTFTHLEIKQTTWSRNIYTCTFFPLLTTLVCYSWSYWIHLQWAACRSHYSCSWSIQCMSDWMSGRQGSDGHPLSSHLHTRNFHPQSKPCCTCQQWFLLGDVHSCKCIGSPLVGLRKQTQSHCKMLCIWNGTTSTIRMNISINLFRPVYQLSIN